MRLRFLLLALPLLLFVACGEDSPSRPSNDGNPPPDRGQIHAVFVGNSLTYTHDVPGFVQTVAETAGESFSWVAVVSPGVSLEDHWYAGSATRAIRREEPDVVVLQQGPSSLPQNQVHLREWAGRFAGVAREVGAEPGLYMVWPESARSEAFDAVSQSYSDAAAAVEGYLFPAGEAWRSIWQRAPDAALYGPDGFHPSRKGALVAALTIFRVLFDRPVTELPAALEPRTSGLPGIELDPAEARAFYEGVEEAVSRFGGR